MNVGFFPLPEHAGIIRIWWVLAAAITVTLGSCDKPSVSCYLKEEGVKDILSLSGWGENEREKRWIALLVKALGNQIQKKFIFRKFKFKTGFN